MSYSLVRFGQAKPFYGIKNLIYSPNNNHMNPSCCVGQNSCILEHYQSCNFFYDNQMIDRFVLIEGGNDF